ncbi:P [Southwest carpet python virus]|uniref:P n=1 Tax=Southwest carpet python virus TaxID=2016402 RepID=A0A2K8MV95_9MONO|nr:P [Southwest carpet python virus] [Southwest carpet python virus]ATY47621.1 P [Southwest carpet python virus] [Southwest carpet python virus]
MESRSTEPIQEVDALYKQIPAILEELPQSLLIQGQQFADSGAPTGMESEPLAMLHEKVKKAKRKREIVDLQSNDTSDDDGELPDPLVGKVDVLISKVDGLALLVDKRFSLLEGRIDKLQSDIAYLGSRAAEGRPIQTPIQPFGPPAAIPTAPVSHLYPDLPNNSWDDLGM